MTSQLLRKQIVFMGILSFLGDCTSLDKFLKTFNGSDTKVFFPYEWLDSYDKL